ncbi:hypothetical protein [Treponema sp. R80B11-R83G3]
MLRRNFIKILSVTLGLVIVTMFFSCMSTEEREKINQWELEGRNKKTGLFDEPYSGKSFQEKKDMEEFMTTVDYQRAFENYQRFLIAYNENQRKIDEQNRIIDAENIAIDRRNAEINRRNAEIDRSITAFKNSAQRDFENWQMTQLRRFNLYPDPNKALLNSGSSGSVHFEMQPINRMGLVTDGFIATGRITINEQIVFNDTLRILPTSPFPAKQRTETHVSRVQNTMLYNPNTTY